MPHESASNIIGFYQRHAVQWDEIRNRQFPEQPWFRRFVDALAPDSTLLDLGCGSGNPTGTYLLTQGHRVTGIDSSPPLIALCRQRHPTQRWMVGDMRDVSLNKHFHGIIAWDSFFHLPRDDQRNMFARFAAHALPGAMLLFNSGNSDGEAIGNFLGEALYHASLNADEYHSLLNEHGFSVVAHEINDVNCGGRNVWLCKRCQ